MLKEEFIARTGYTLTDEEYAAIEEDYYKFDGYKDAFCKAFDVKAFKSAQKAKEMENMCRENERMKEEIKALHAQAERMATENAALKEELEKEQEWKTSDGAGTNMKQEDYESLVRCGREMMDEEAKAWIHNEFGFDMEMIEILHEASTMEVNRHRRMRTGETFRRLPIYEATDWNYVRFDVRGKGGMWSWETINGELLAYIN